MLTVEATTCKEAVSGQIDQYATVANEMISDIIVTNSSVGPKAIQQVTDYLNNLNESDLSLLGKYAELHAATSSNYNISSSTPTLMLSNQFLTAGGLLILGASTNFQIDEILSGGFIQKLGLIVANHQEGDTPKKVESLFSSLRE